MDTQALFSTLQNYEKILVTGPQRSGTTITSKILAAESGYRCIDEKHFRVKDTLVFRQFLEQDERMVIQCPAMTSIIEEFGTPENLIVFMHRNPADIIASQRRIDWANEQDEKLRYSGKVTYLPHELTPVCVLKYLHWHFEQKQTVCHFVDLPYDSLAGHQLWIEEDLRSTFGPKQTALDADHIP